MTTFSTALAEESTGLLRDKGVLGINKAYECTVDTTRPDAVKARASIAWGWGPIKTGLSYMQLPKGMTTADGRDGVWSYCIDISTNTVNGHSYSITKLEEGQDYSTQSASKLRAVLMNSYPHKSLEDLERIYGLTDLTREEACAATQWVIWYYSNPEGLLESGGSGEYYPADLYNPSTYSRSTMAVVCYDENIILQQNSLLTSLRSREVLQELTLQKIMKQSLHS